MDFETIALSVVVIVAVAAFAKWYFKQTDNSTIDYDFENYVDPNDIDIDDQEMNLGLDDRIRDMINPPTPEVDEDPYGENSSYPSYRATLVNRGKESQK